MTQRAQVTLGKAALIERHGPADPWHLHARNLAHARGEPMSHCSWVGDSGQALPWVTYLGALTHGALMRPTRRTRLGATWVNAPA